MWFIDVNCVHIKLFNDFVTCLFWFTVRRLPCSVKRGRIFIGSENEVFCGKPYSRDKMMDVILILEPICTAMHEWYHNCFSCIPLMLLSRHHPQEIISHWILWLSVVTTICFIMMYCSIQWAICVDIHSRTHIDINSSNSYKYLYILSSFFSMNAFPLAISAASFSLNYFSMQLLFSEITTNVHTFIVSSCSFEGASSALLLPVTLQVPSRAPGKSHRLEPFCMYLRPPLYWMVCFILCRVGLSELLLWWWPLWLDQRQRRRPALGDDARSVR